MKRGRVFAHIFEINSFEVKAYLLPGTDSLIQGHIKGISKIARIGSYVIVNSAGTKLVGIVNSLHVTEPEKLYWIRTKPELKDNQLIRIIVITLIGQFYYNNKNELLFERGINSYPSIDEEVIAPTQDELNLILNERMESDTKLLELGVSYPSNDVMLKINPIKMFSRHCGIFGSTGNGKSCTVTILLNEIIDKKLNIPMFIFDINGEYPWAFKNHDNVRILKFCGELDKTYPREKKDIFENLKFNYKSFSRLTLRSILKPSERTQIPALNFARDVLEYLPLSVKEMDLPADLKQFIPQHLKDSEDMEIYRNLIGDPSVTDGSRIKRAYDTLEFLAILSAKRIKLNTNKMVYMSQLSKVISDRWSIQPGRNALEYNAFRYQNVASLCDRIIELCRDSLFRIFCDTTGQSGIELTSTSATKYKDKSGIEKESKITIFDLSLVPQEYIPIVLDSMLEQHLQEALSNKFIGQPHLLVLDEAHHYLGSRVGNDNTSIYLSNPPGERIAKEGRKYGLHLLVSSQRPREMSNTIISQLGTVIAHALTHESDRDIISGFGTYNDRTILNSLAILPRREAIIVGQAISMPTRFKVKYLEEDKQPKSRDPLEDLL